MIVEIEKSGQVVVEAGSSYVQWDASWTHAGTALYVLEGISLEFTAGNGNCYSVYAYETIGGQPQQRMNKEEAASQGDTVTLAMDRQAWENRTSGTISIKFRRRTSLRAVYSGVKLLLTYRNAASASTVTVQPAVAGDPQTVNISNTDQDVYHTVRWQYGSADNETSTGVIDSGVLTYGAATRTPAWAVPAASLESLWLANTTSASVPGTVTVQTYTQSGDAVGDPVTASAVLTLQETDATRPVITAAAMSTSHDTTAQAIRATTGHGDDLIQGHTTGTYTVTATGYRGAGISQVRIITPTRSATGSSGTGISLVMGSSGTYTVGVEVTDTRGFVRTAAAQWELQVMAYTDPAVTSLQAMRCDSNGNEAEDGGYIWVEATASVSSMSQGMTMTAALRQKGGSQIGATATMQNGTVILGTNLSEDLTYVVTVTVTDDFSMTGTAEIEIGTGIVTMSRLAGGKGVAFGKAADRFGVEVRKDWPFYVHGSEILRLMVEVAHPPGSVMETEDETWDPNEEWPWTVWGKSSGKWVRGQ